MGNPKELFKGTSKGLWGTTYQNVAKGTSTPIVCVLAGSGRIEKIFPAMGAVLLENWKDLRTLLEAQRDMIKPRTAEDATEEEIKEVAEDLRKGREPSGAHARKMHVPPDPSTIPPVRRSKRNKKHRRHG